VMRKPVPMPSAMRQPRLIARESWRHIMYDRDPFLEPLPLGSAIP
jgi:hypothetical protein